MNRPHEQLHLFLVASGAGAAVAGGAVRVGPRESMDVTLSSETIPLPLPSSPSTALSTPSALPSSAPSSLPSPPLPAPRVCSPLSPWFVCSGVEKVQGARAAATAASQLVRRRHAMRLRSLSSVVVAVGSPR
jgi:hypothetical protein